MDQRLDGWMDGSINGWMIDGWMNGSMNGWMDGWINNWKDGWMDGWSALQTMYHLEHLLLWSNACTSYCPSYAK